jgi:hypothetical protein
MIEPKIRAGRLILDEKINCRDAKTTALHVVAHCSNGLERSQCEAGGSNVVPLPGSDLSGRGTHFLRRISVHVLYIIYLYLYSTLRKEPTRNALAAILRTHGRQRKFL